MTRLEQTLDGKLLPEYVRLYRDEDTGAMEVRYWRFQPMILPMVPFVCVWTYMTVGKVYIEPLMEGLPITNGLSGVPFVLGALYLWGIAVVLLFGRGRVRLENGQGRYTFKVFGIGVSRSFELRGNTDVEIEAPKMAGGGGLSLPFGAGQDALCIYNGYRSVTICKGWSSDAIDFVAALLRQKRI